MQKPLIRCLLSRWIHVRHQLHLNPAILGSAGSRAIAGYLLILADTDEIELVRRNVVLRRKIIHDRIRATLAQAIVVVRIARGVRAARDRENVAALLRQRLAAKSSSVLRSSAVRTDLSKPKVTFTSDDRLVIVQVRDHAVERIDAVVSLLRRLPCRVSRLPGGHRMLIRRIGRALRLRNTRLRPLVRIDDRSGDR